MISNLLNSNAISTYSQPAVDGELLATAAGSMSEASALAGQAGASFDGAVDLQQQIAATLIDRMAHESRSLLAKVSWRKETLAPLEVAVKQLMGDIARVRSRENETKEAVARNEETSQNVGSNLQKAVDALANVRSALLQL